MPFSIDGIIEKISKKDLNDVTKSKSSRKLKFPCSICESSVMSNQKAIQCDSCNLWAHIKCDGTSLNDYNDMMDPNNFVSK